LEAAESSRITAGSTAGKVGWQKCKTIKINENSFKWLNATAISDYNSNIP